MKRGESQVSLSTAGMSFSKVLAEEIVGDRVTLGQSYFLDYELVLVLRMIRVLNCSEYVFGILP